MNALKRLIWWVLGVPTCRKCGAEMVQVIDVFSAGGVTEAAMYWACGKCGWRK